MLKWILIIFFVLSLFEISCTLNKQSAQDKLSSSWKLPDPDVKMLPNANYKSLTQIYHDHSLENRDITYRDERLLTMRGINTVYNKFPDYKTVNEWEKRKKYLRQHILVCAGLWPLPPKTPLHPKYYHKIVHDDYTVETVTIEPYPGFYLGGNLYRPIGEGPFPAVLCPHGHFKYGRLTSNSITSIPGRCINFAKQGYVVFAYDMVGYNDTKQVSHTFADDSISRLYGINLLGLQLWNSMRALDFLLSLPGVDTSRVGITGASGGGTQTFLLTAVDDRFQVAAPVNMVSNLMQGGDLCENAPGLRVNTFNVEIAAMIAPKPLLLVSDTHDWTYGTRNTIMPMMRSVYALYGAKNKLKNEHFDYPHNYNKVSREAVYQWFGKWLLHENDPDKLREKPFEVDSSKNLLAFMNKKTSDRVSTFEQLPPKDYHDAPKKLDENGLKALLKGIYRKQLNQYWPKDKQGIKTFEQIYGTAIQHLVEAKMPHAVEFKIMGRSKGENFIATQLLISKKDKNEWIPCILYQPLSASKKTIILTSDEGKRNWVRENSSAPDQVIENLLKNGFNVIAPDLLKQGEHVLPDSTMTRRDEESKYFTTYNLTDRQEQIQDILTIIKAIKENKDLSGHIDLWATGNTGMTALLLASAGNYFDQVVIDGNHFDPSADQNMLKLQIPGLMRIGGLKTVLALSSIKDYSFLLYNVNPQLIYPEVTKISKLEENDSSFIITKGRTGTNKIISFFRE